MKIAAPYAGQYKGSLETDAQLPLWSITTEYRNSNPLSDQQFNMTYPQPALRSLIVAVTFTFAATVTVGLRLLARRLKRVELGCDDLMIAVGLIFTYPVMILLILGKLPMSIKL